MKGKLHKMVSGYILSLNGDIDDPYAIVNEELAKDHEWYKLSLKNCQAIERGYDLEELAEETYPIFNLSLNATTAIHALHQESFKEGFQKALELIGDKKFSEKDMIKFMQFIISTEELGNTSSVSTSTAKYYIDKFFDKQQQNEWEVDIEMEYVGECNGNNDEGCFQDSPGHNCGCFKRKPKLDADGCLILKRI